MGVYIGGMRKPDNCFECKMFTYDDDCIFQNEITDSYEEQYRNCPLIEVKEPHGDLIDIENLKRSLEHGGMTSYRAQKVIIPAEGE